jgi:abortive infection bacteriophage resistance protein
MQYSKPALLISEQIAALERKGMVFSDRQVAEHYLSHISYYRFRAYTYPYQNNTVSAHPFWRPTKFERVLNDYILDRKLRIVIFDAMEKIEIALRTQIIYQYSTQKGSHWYEDSSNFRKKHLFDSDLKHLDGQLNRSQEDFIKHYKKKYTNPARPPVWMALEVSTIGTLSKIYDNLILSTEKKAVARHFGLGHPFVLESWMKTFSHIRNICAHHSRLWNRPITIIPIFPQKPIDLWVEQGSFSEPHKLYASLCCIRYFLNRISPGNNFGQKIGDLLDLFPTSNLSAMGFPKDWESEPLWKQ